MEDDAAEIRRRLSARRLCVRTMTAMNDVRKQACTWAEITADTFQETVKAGDLLISLGNREEYCNRIVENDDKTIAKSSKRNIIIRVVNEL